jgi:DNA-binding SARP family transcriptional activator
VSAVAFGVDTDGPTFRLLDSVTVRGPSGECVELPAAKQRMLLTALLLHPNEWVTSTRLIDALWGEVPPRSAMSNLKTYVWRLRVLLYDLTGSSRVQSRAGSYRLDVGHGELDTMLFADLIGQGRPMLAAGRPDLAAQALDGALALWRKEPYDDSPAPLLVESRLAHLRELFYSAQEQLVEIRLSMRQPDRVIPMLRMTLAQQPLRERPWAQLISALIQAGRRAEAVAAYREVSLLLHRELGLEPGSGIKTAYLSALGS